MSKDTTAQTKPEQPKLQGVYVTFLRNGYFLEARERLTTGRDLLSVL